MVFQINLFALDALRSLFQSLNILSQSTRTQFISVQVDLKPKSMAESYRMTVLCRWRWISASNWFQSRSCSEPRMSRPSSWIC